MGIKLLSGPFLDFLDPIYKIFATKITYETHFIGIFSTFSTLNLSNE